MEPIMKRISITLTLLLLMFAVSRSSYIRKRSSGDDNILKELRDLEKRDDYLEKAKPMTNLIELAKSLNLTGFVKRVYETDVSKIVNHEGKYTVFAPNNTAFKHERQYPTTSSLNDKMLFHVGYGKINSRNMYNEMLIKSLLQGRTIRINIYQNGRVVTANGRVISQKNYEAQNGVIHILENTMSSIYDPHGSIISELMTHYPQHSVFIELIKISKLFPTLNKIDMPITLLAPTNAAIGKLEPNVIPRLKKNVHQLRAAIMGHILRGTYFTPGFNDGDRVMTAYGNELQISITRNGTYKIGQSIFTLPNIVAENGAIHSVDTMLIPTPVMDSLDSPIEDSDQYSTTTKTFFQSSKASQTRYSSMNGEDTQERSGGSSMESNEFPSQSRNYDTQERSGGSSIGLDEFPPESRNYDMQERSDGSSMGPNEYPSQSRNTQDDYSDYEDSSRMSKGLTTRREGYHQSRYGGYTSQYEGSPSQYKSSSMQYENSPKQYEGPPSQYKSSSMQYENSPMQYEGSPSQYKSSSMQYENSPLQYDNPSLQHRNYPLQKEYSPQYDGYSSSYEGPYSTQTGYSSKYEDSSFDQEGSLSGYEGSRSQRGEQTPGSEVNQSKQRKSPIEWTQSVSEETTYKADPNEGNEITSSYGYGEDVSQTPLDIPYSNKYHTSKNEDIFGEEETYEEGSNDNETPYGSRNEADSDTPFRKKYKMTQDAGSDEQSRPEYEEGAGGYEGTNSFGESQNSFSNRMGNKDEKDVISFLTKCGHVEFAKAMKTNDIGSLFETNLDNFYTIFAPTDDGWRKAKLTSNVSEAALVNSYIVSGIRNPYQESVLETLAGNFIRFDKIRKIFHRYTSSPPSLTANGISIDDEIKSVKYGHIRVYSLDGGFSHVSTMEDDTIMKRLLWNNNYSKFVTYITVFGMDSLIASRRSTFTILAPTNEAINKAEMMNDERDVASALLANHFVPGSYYAMKMKHDGVITTLSGRKIGVRSSYSGLELGEGVKILLSDITTSNGVVHEVNKVIFD